MTKKRVTTDAQQKIGVTITAQFTLAEGLSISDITECVEVALGELRATGEAKAVMYIPACRVEIA